MFVSNLRLAEATLGCILGAVAELAPGGILGAVAELAPGGILGAAAELAPGGPLLLADLDLDLEVDLAV
jgi:hypothetical protein